MSDKLLKRLAGALVVLVIAWGVLALVRRPPEDSTKTLALGKIDTASVDSLSVAKAHDTIVVARSSGARGRWLASGYPADSTAVRDLLQALADTSRHTELVAENRTSHARLGVSADSGAHVVVFGKGAKQLELVAGTRTGDYGGVNVRRPNEDAVFALKGPLADQLTRAPSDWRDKRVAGIVPESVATIQVLRSGKHYELRRSGSAWTLSSGKPADSSAVVDLLGTFRDLRASGFASKTERDSLDFDKPTASVRLASKSGAPLVDLALDSAASGQWARAAGNTQVFKMDAWAWGHLAPAESTLAAKPKKH